MREKETASIAAQTIRSSTTHIQSLLSDEEDYLQHLILLLIPSRANGQPVSRVCYIAEPMSAATYTLRARLAEPLQYGPF